MPVKDPRICYTLVEFTVREITKIHITKSPGQWNAAKTDIVLDGLAKGKIYDRLSEGKFYLSLGLHAKDNPLWLACLPYKIYLAVFNILQNDAHAMKLLQTRTSVGFLNLVVNFLINLSSLFKISFNYNFRKQII